jgi:hypothetical protein
VLISCALRAAPAQATTAGGATLEEDEVPGAASEREAPDETFRDEPADVEAPRMRNVEPRTRIYVDGTVAASRDLSALPTIAGSARGARVAVGGSLKLGRFQLDAELPGFQVTRLDLLDVNEAIMIDPRDRRQTSYALGDARAGAQWTAALPIDTVAVVAGLGVGVRVPTHTGRFTFHLVDGSEGFYVLPYYFHVQPALLFGVAGGPITFVMNQGALVMLGPDGEVANLPVETPTLYFWDAHYALALRAASWLGLSLAASTTVQLSRLDPVMFPRLNHVRAAFLMPGLMIRAGASRIDLVARFGVTPGAEPLGVITYSGTRSLLLRVTREFD